MKEAVNEGIYKLGEWVREGLTTRDFTGSYLKQTLTTLRWLPGEISYLDKYLKEPSGSAKRRDREETVGWILKGISRMKELGALDVSDLLEYSPQLCSSPSPSTSSMMESPSPQDPPQPRESQEIYGGYLDFTEERWQQIKELKAEIDTIRRSNV